MNKTKEKPEDHLYLCPRCLENRVIKQVDVYSDPFNRPSKINILCEVHGHFTIIGSDSTLRYSNLKSKAFDNFVTSAALFAQTKWLDAVISYMKLKIKWREFKNDRL